MLRIAGPTIVSLTLFGWVMLLWIGVFLIFSSTDNAVLSSSNNQPASSLERFYFTGYMLSTMGNGDFKAGTDILSVFSSFMSFTGLMLITIAISYMVPVLSAVTQRRALSIKLAAIGGSAQKIILDNWNGSNLKQLESQLDSLEQDIALQGQMHLSYPVLQYFHHNQRATALFPNIASLDEAISIILLYFPKDLQPGQQHLNPVRKAITSFLESLNVADPRIAKVEVPPIDVGQLQERNLPLLSAKPEDLYKLENRRKILKVMTEQDGWSWSDAPQTLFNKKLDLPELT
ncbi:potassium channel family protein [uncultured Pontibacter sp.]|uniref:potassium channel family protein n=1 Tax=uncultured Pontibacter sp. TaxID=453356 RepID=UPI002619C905|nr:potassium channel family protein [uncultured Pontibacter sp.]